MSKILVIDLPNLAHRHFHARGLDAKAVQPGVLRSAGQLHSQFEPDLMVWCFDGGGTNVRKSIHKEYKANRLDDHKNRKPGEKEAYEEMRRRTVECGRLLRGVGFRNVFRQKGYEADDLIASVVKHSLGPDDEAVIVSSDNDMHQLLTNNVSVYNAISNVRLTLGVFEFGVGCSPKKWPKVKALTGDKADNVIGIAGCGIKTAVRYVQGKLSTKTKIYRTIQEQQEQLLINEKLVTLPYEGTRKFKLRPDKVTPERWRSTVRGLSYPF